MLTKVAEGVRVHESACIQSNAVVVEGAAGVLVVDPGITRAELACLAGDIAGLGREVVTGFSTHPDWDHVLWHVDLGDAPRFATGAAATSIRQVLARPGWEADVAEGLPPEVAGEVPMELLGQVAALPPGATSVPWDGPRVRLLEHRAHATGHAALLVDGVLIAGDMLSDVLVPMLDLTGVPDPVGDYLAALDLLEGVAGDVDAVVPGHGSTGDAAELRRRIAADRAYVESLRDGADSADARIGPDAKPGWEWVVYVHDGQLERLAQLG